MAGSRVEFARAASWEGKSLSTRRNSMAGDVRYSDHFVDQRHAEYSALEHGVWREVLARNAALIAEYGHMMNPVYIQGMRELELPAHVPAIEQINRRLARTGWRTVCVDGYIPSAAYATLVSQNIFPISRKVRRQEHVDYAPEPDLVHDVLGHLPMLFSPDYRTYLQRFGAVMAQAKENELDPVFFATVTELAALESEPGSAPSEIEKVQARLHEVLRSIASGASELTHLRRLYVWSVEFGVTGSNEDFSIHGAALLSAPAEFRSLCARGESCLRSFGIDVVAHENPFTDLLSEYFVARDFAHLHEVLSEYELRMALNDRVPQTSEIRQIAGATQKVRIKHA